MDSKEYLNGLFCYKRECIYKINIRYGWLKDLCCKGDGICLLCLERFLSCVGVLDGD